jgi:Xaa-Pro aminopeptidase
VLDNLRLYKNEDEIQLIKIASSTADNAVKYMLGNIKPDVSTEVGIASEGEFFIRRKGMDIGYDTIIASGKNTMDKTWRPSSNVIKKGDILLINIVPRHKGYCSFFTILHPIDNSYAKEICSISKKIIKYMIENIKQGDSSNKIYELYYEKTKEYGLLNHFSPFSNSEKSIGHSTGLEVVEYPYINKDNNIILENNMVLSLKYNLYNFKFGDIRFEFNVLIDDKAILLNRYLIEE